MNKLICNNIILSKCISYLILYILIFSFLLVFITDTKESVYLFIKSIFDYNGFISFVFIPSCLLLTSYLLDNINNNFTLIVRFSDKKEYTNYLLRLLTISISIIDIIIITFITIFTFIFKTNIFELDYYLLLILNLFINSLIISLLVFILKIYFNKYIVTFIVMLLSIFIFIFYLDLSFIMNSLSMYMFILKIILIIIGYIFIINIYPRKCFKGSGINAFFN